MKHKKEFMFVVISFIVFGVALVLQCRKGDFLVVLTRLKAAYVIGAIILLMGYWLLEACMIRRLIIKTHGNQIKDPGWIALKTTLIGQYYSHITPFSSGGQPMQLYWLKKHNISMSHGTSVLVTKFLLYQITVTVYALILTLSHYEWVMQLSHAIKAALFIGLFINVFGVMVIAVIALNPYALIRITSCIGTLLKKIKWLKGKRISDHKVRVFVSQYDVAMTKLKQDPLQTLYFFVLSWLQVTLFFGITVMIYKALGLSGESVIKIITLQSMVYMCVAFVPIPGTLGASEIGFSAVLALVFPHSIIHLAMLLWRFISYYFSMVFCGCFTILMTYSKPSEIKV